jgi:UDP-glucose 4-epimerase
MKFKKAVVTGAAGFIGSHLTRRLYDSGVEVLAVDNFSNVPDSRVKFLFPNNEVDIKHIDVTDRNSFGVELESFGDFDVFYDLAYINGTKQFYTRPLEILAHAGKHVQESFYWVNKFSARWVYFSTPEIYGEPDLIPTPEEHRMVISEITNPRFSYAIGKIFSESYIHGALISDNDLDVVIVRPNNAYGPTDRYHVISELMEKIFSGEPLSIQGTGEETRAFCYVEDMVEQILLIASAGICGETYSMGSDCEISIAQLIECVSKVTGYQGDILKVPLMLGSPNRRCPDLSKLRALGLLGSTDLISGIEKTYALEKMYRSI